MGVISIQATIRCDGHNCSSVTTSEDVSSHITNICGDVYSEIHVYSPVNWLEKEDSRTGLVKYFCNLCKRKYNK